MEESHACKATKDERSYKVTVHEVVHKATEKKRMTSKKCACVATKEHERIEVESHKAIYLKKKKEEEEISGMSTPVETKSMLFLTSPLNSGTPLNVIPSNFLYLSWKLLEFDNEVIIL
jgi:hypothetical protein